MIFDYMEKNNITNFGYIILFDNKPSLNILNDDHSFVNDIIIEDIDNLYSSIGDNEVLIVGINIKNQKGVFVNSMNLTYDNAENMIYSIFTLYIYTIKTNGLTTDDFVDLELIDILFYDILDKYIKERSD